jgi:anti-sigma regulatory factor (Ser/Thr protein kinase)
VRDAGGEPALGGADHAVELTIPSDPRYMKLVRSLVGAAAQVVGFEKPDVNHVCLAVDEACTNIIRHAYGGDHGRKIEVRLVLHPDRLDVNLRDYGRKAEPGEIKPRELDDIRPGGLGVHFIREIMDQVVYDTSPEVGTELRMTKSRPNK